LLGDVYFAQPLPLTDVPAPHLFIMPLGTWDQPDKYDQAIFEGSTIQAIVHKPKQQVSDYIVAGTWVFSSSLFATVRELFADGHTDEMHPDTFCRD
jgi:hypothetical protein